MCPEERKRGFGHPLLGKGRFIQGIRYWATGHTAAQGGRNRYAEGRMMITAAAKKKFSLS